MIFLLARHFFLEGVTEPLGPLLFLVSVLFVCSVNFELLCSDLVLIQSSLGLTLCVSTALVIGLKSVMSVSAVVHSTNPGPGTCLSAMVSS